MELYAAVQPFVLTIDEYQATFGEDDPEELALLQLQDKELARQIAGVLADLYYLETDLAEPKEGEGLAEEVGTTEDLHELRVIAAALHGKTVDDYHEGRAPAGMQFNHLINHDDSSGYYVPYDFMQAFFVEEVSVGSSVALLAELDALEPVLAERFPEEMAQVAMVTDDDLRADVTGPVGVWHSLRRLCRSSVELGLPIHLG